MMLHTLLSLIKKAEVGTNSPLSSAPVTPPATNRSGGLRPPASLRQPRRRSPAGGDFFSGWNPQTVGATLPAFASMFLQGQTGRDVGGMLGPAGLMGTMALGDFLMNRRMGRLFSSELDTPTPAASTPARPPATPTPPLVPGLVPPPASPTPPGRVPPPTAPTPMRVPRALPTAPSRPTTPQPAGLPNASTLLPEPMRVGLLNEMRNALGRTPTQQELDRAADIELYPIVQQLRERGANVTRQTVNNLFNQQPANLWRDLPASAALNHGSDYAMRVVARNAPALLGNNLGGRLIGAAGRSWLPLAVLTDLGDQFIPDSWRQNQILQYMGADPVHARTGASFRRDLEQTPWWAFPLSITSNPASTVRAVFADDPRLEQDREQSRGALQQLGASNVAAINATNASPTVNPQALRAFVGSGSFPGTQPHDTNISVIRDIPNWVRDSNRLSLLAPHYRSTTAGVDSLSALDRGRAVAMERLEAQGGHNGLFPSPTGFRAGDERILEISNHQPDQQLSDLSRQVRSYDDLMDLIRSVEQIQGTRTPQQQAVLDALRQNANQFLPIGLRNQAYVPPPQSSPSTWSSPAAMGVEAIEILRRLRQ